MLRQGSTGWCGTIRKRDALRGGLHIAQCFLRNPCHNLGAKAPCLPSTIGNDEPSCLSHRFQNERLVQRPEGANIKDFRPEILRWLPESDFDVSDQQAVASWLEETDGIKFAGKRPLLPETEMLMKRAEEMVRRGEEIADERERLRREAKLLTSEEEQP